MDQRHDRASARSRQQFWRDFAHNSEALAASMGMSVPSHRPSNELERRKNEVAYAIETDFSFSAALRMEMGGWLRKARAHGPNLRAVYEDILLHYRNRVLRIFPQSQAILEGMTAMPSTLLAQATLNFKIMAQSFAPDISRALEQAVNNQNEGLLMQSLLEAAYSAQASWKSHDTHLIQLIEVAVKMGDQ